MKIRDAARLYKGEHLLAQFAELSKGKRRYAEDTVSWGLDKLAGKNAKLPMKNGKVDGSKIPKKNRAPGWNYAEQREMTSEEKSASASKKPAKKAEMDSPPTANSQGFQSVQTGTMKKASDRNPDWKKEQQNKQVKSSKPTHMNGPTPMTRDKGVHTAHWSGRPGESTAGMQLRDKAQMMSSAKDKHIQKLSELRAQSKPNLPKVEKAREDEMAPPEARGQYRQERRKFEPRDHMADDLTSEKGVSDTGIEIRRADKRNPGVLSHGYARVQEPEKHKQNAANRIRERLAMARMNRSK